MTLKTKKTLGTQAILMDAAKLIFIFKIHFLADLIRYEIVYTQYQHVSYVHWTIIPHSFLFHPISFLLTQVYRGSMQSHLKSVPGRFNRYLRTKLLRAHAA